MEAQTRTTPIGRKLGLLTLASLLLSGLNAAAAVIPIVDETFDPPFLVPLGDWGAGGVAWVSRDYANTGVGQSMAVQLSGEFIPGPDHWFNTGIYQSGGVGGNELATPDNTVLSFDLKVDRPDMENVSVIVQGWKGLSWNAFDPTLPVTSSVGLIPVGKYTPGVFKHVVVPLNAPLWGEDLYSFPFVPPLFDPSSKTCQIAIGLGDGTFASLDGSFTVTIDNLQLVSKNDLIPWAGTETGDMRWVEGQEWTAIDVKATGVAEHFGQYTETITFPQLPYAIFGPVEITVANGEKLFGVMCGGSFNPAAVPIQGEWGIVIEGGTGRFVGATGSLNIRGAWTDLTLAHYTAKCSGALSTVGSNKK